MKNILYIAICLVSFPLFSQETMHPSPAQSKKIVITGGTIHIGNGQVVSGNIIIEKGKLKIDMNAPALTGDIEHIDATGKQIYPGIIAPNTNLGLVEVSSTKSTVDNVELGDIHPNIRSIVAYNTDSKVINTLRSNGILLAQIVPSGGLIPGTSTVVQLDAWNWEDAAYALDNGVHLTMPALINRPSFMSYRRRDADVDQVKLGLERIDMARSFFKEAQAYLNEKTHAATNLKYEACKGLFDRSKSLYVNCDLVKEMLAAIHLAAEFNFKLVIVGGTDAWMIGDILKENKVAVILAEPHSLPATDDDAVDQPYKTGAMLQKAGVLFTICQDGSDGYSQQRNLVFQAGTMVAYGLTKEEALQAITLNAAKILGIDSRTGSLENGKDANLVICSGDILDMKSSTVTHAFIQGRAVNLDNKHSQLFERYKYKYSIK